jgi:hypothetical protein
VKRVTLCLVLVMGFLVAIGSTSFGGQTNLLPNGSFEFWSRVAPEALPPLLKSGRFDSGDPLVPTRWSMVLRGGLVRQTNDVHGGKAALALQGDWPQLRLSHLEVVPGASYTFGVWAKGQGRVIVRLYGVAPEGDQQLGERVADISHAWQAVSAPVVIPNHIRFVSLYIEALKADMLLDDAHVSAELDQPYDADAVLRDKFVADADTLLLADFEKEDAAIKLEGKSRCVDGGRFGRCLRVEKPDSAMIPLKLAELPAAGTIEFWLSPDEIGQLVKLGPGQQAPINFFVSIDNASGAMAQITADTSATLRFSWKYGQKKGAALAGSSEVSLARMRKGQWTHMAIAWEPGGTRMYVDGVLYAWNTRDPFRLSGLPTHLSVSSFMYGHLTWNGCIDEIRVSKVNRFAPPLPREAKPNPLPPIKDAAVTVTPADPDQARKAAADLDLQRKALLATLPATREGAFELQPNADGDYVYEATAARALVAGTIFEPATGVIISPKKAGKPVEPPTNAAPSTLPGADIKTVRIGKPEHHLIGQPVNGGAYWTLGSIRPGHYYPGLIYQCSQPGGELPSGDLPVALYLNGRIVQAGGRTRPLQVAPGIWFTEIHACESESLKPGDEIEAVTSGGLSVRIVRLLLHPRKPATSAYRAPLHFGEHWWSNVDTALRVNAECRFVGANGEPLPAAGILGWGQEQECESAADFARDGDGKSYAICRLANPLPVAVTVNYACVIKGYWGQVAGGETLDITLQPHERVTRRIPFAVTDDDHAYSMQAFLTPTESSRSLIGQLGWPEMDRLAFFPGYRQLVPWHHPATSKHALRVSFKQPLKLERRSLSLNGSWQRAFFYELVPAEVPPTNAQWKTVGVPMSQTPLAQSPDRQFGAYLRRTFRLEDDPAPRTYQLVISHAAAEATAYVNGRKVGVLRGSNTPLVVDVSTSVKPGENEILIIVRDLLAVMNQDYVNPRAPVASPLYLDAPSSFEAVNRILLGSVSLTAAPAVAADDLLVFTSVRKQNIAAKWQMVNHNKAPVRAIVKATVLDARKPVFELGSQEVLLEAGKTLPMEFAKNWPDARLWSPLDPHLYVLAVEVTDAATGRRLDDFRTRFGFRESWIQDADIYFNGYKIKPKSLTTPLPYGIDLEYTMGRGSKIPDYMDENGFLATEGLAGVGNSSSKHNVDRDPFWEAARANVLAGARRLQNHPCIIAWDLSNEWYGFLSYSGADPLKGARRLRSLTEVLEKQDPTRWTFYNGDEDLDGLHYAFAGHYLSPYGNTFGDEYRMDGRAHFLPDGYFFRPLDQSFKVGQEVIVSPARRKSIAYGKKLLMNTEHLWKVGSMMPPGPTRMIGEENVLSPAVDGGSGAAAWLHKQNLDGHRDLGCSVIAFYGGVCPSRRGYMLQQFIMPDLVHHAYAGRHFSRDYSLHNDLFVPAVVSLAYRFIGPDGVVHSRGEEAYTMSSADLKRGTIAFQLPQVDRRTTFTLDLQMKSRPAGQPVAENRVVYAEQRDIELWPDKPIAPVLTNRNPLRKVMLFDPAGATAALLREAGVAFSLTEGVREWDRPANTESGWVFIVGQDALNTENASDLARLEGFVTRGGRVIVLSQGVTPGALPVATTLEPRHQMSQLFMQTPDHPVLKGVTDWDLHFWAPRRVTGNGAYVKPDGGAMTVLLNSGGHSGMEWMQMFECYRGQGFYLLCQLPLVSAAGEEPMAREVLARLTAYALNGQPYSQPVKQMHVLTEPGSLLDKKLQELGVSFVPVADSRPLGAGEVGMIDAAHPQAAKTAEAWRDGLAAGADVVVVNAAPGSAAWLTALAGKEARVTVQPYRDFEGRGYRTGFGRLTAGLTHLDHYFKKYDGSEAAGRQAEVPELAIEPFVNHSVTIEGGDEWVFPGALVEVPVGSGRLVVDQRRWTTAHVQLQKHAARIGSALALGLNVAVAPVVPLRQLPEGVAYRTVDLSAFANRSLTDDTPDDGKGGWPDQGRKCDVRTFQTGKQIFQGVPFEIAPGNAAVVLRNIGRPGAPDFPTEVTIPIGLRIEGFYVLQSAAFTPANFRIGLYQVLYADGSSIDVPLTTGINIHDWSSDDVSFAREKGTRSMIAWTGSNEIFPKISISRMLWPNPRPESVVISIRFANPSGKATIMMTGLTLVLNKEEAAAPPGEVARAREMLTQATRLIQESKFDEARRLLEQAVQSDPSMSAAHQALADLMERSGDEDAAFKVYQAWAVAGATTPLPYNRIGEILEKRKDFRGALEAYTKSIEIEWNQPPTIEAKSRMQKLGPGGN